MASEVVEALIIEQGFRQGFQLLKRQHLVAERLRQHLRGKSHQLLISHEQHGRFSARQNQIKAVVHRVIWIARQCQCFQLEMTVWFDVIHGCSDPAEEQLQAPGLQLSSSLLPPEHQPLR